MHLLPQDNSVGVMADALPWAAMNTRCALLIARHDIAGGVPSLRQMTHERKLRCDLVAESSSTAEGRDGYTKLKACNGDDTRASQTVIKGVF